jgi:predicted helicase
VDGQPLGERNPKWLQDDCVKFVRYAQWQLERARRGVIALVCTQAFVHQPTFRAMRNSLARTHHEVRVLDLHGNTKKLECAPDGSKDENVFEIQQGVCVLVLCRERDPSGDVRRVLFADLWGRRSEKLAALDGPIAWRETTPSPPRFAFAPEDDRLRAEYEAGIALDELFERFSPAVVTGRDGFAVARSADEMRARLDAVTSLALGDDRFRARYLRSRDRIDVGLARRRTGSRADAAERIVSCLYRPFDERVLLDLDAWIERPRREVMRAFASTDAVAILARRQSPPARPAPFVFATRLVPVDGVIRSDNHGCESVFPLAIDGHVNFATDALARFERALGRSPPPRDLFAYAYAVLHAPGYRARFATFLRQDYPRIPLPRGDAAFECLARLGASLLACHLQWHGRNPSITAPTAPFRVRTPRFVDGGIDAGTRFAPVSEAAWTFAVGGYQPLRKWLDDRVREILDVASIGAYARIVAAVEETLRIMRTIDDAWTDRA